jgi:hypothetical protein
MVGLRNLTKYADKAMNSHHQGRSVTRKIAVPYRRPRHREITELKSGYSIVWVHKLKLQSSLAEPETITD